MPFFSWLNAGALVASAVVSSALMFIALGAGPRRLINVSFSLYAATEAAWALAVVFTDLQLWLGRGNPQLSAEYAMLFLTLMAPLLLLFTVRYVGGRHLAADIAALLGFAGIAALGVPLFRGGVVQALRLNQAGTALIDVAPLGAAAAAGVAVMLVWSLALLLRAGRAKSEPFTVLGVLVLFAGLAEGIFQPPFPLLTVSNGVSVALIGYGVARRQVFNPLRETTGALQAQVAELERARKALRERARRLELLARVGSEATSILDPDELMRRAVSLVSDGFSYYNVSLFVMEGTEAVLRAATREEFLVHVGTLRLRAGSEGITGWVAGSGTALVVPDVTQDPRYLKCDDRVLTRSELAVPITVGGRVVGVLDAQSAEPDAFSGLDVFTLQTVADQLAIAMENARLYAEARRELTERTAVENRLGILAEQSPNMIFINVRGRVAFANRRCEEIVGWTREELTAPTFDFRVLVAPESLPLVGEMFSRHGRGEEVPPYEYVIVARNGRRLDVIITTRLIDYEGERGIFGIITDITGRKHTERLLRGFNAAALALEKAASPRALFAALETELRAIGLEAAVMSPPYASGTRAVDDLCHRAAATRETLFAGPDPSDRRHAEGPGVVAAATIVAPLLREDTVHGLLVARSPGLLPDDRPAITAFAHQVAAAWHKALLLEELETSLAEVGRIQAQLLQSQKMEAVGRLAGGVAHDFNNLLTAIGGYADLLRLQLPDAEQRSHAESIAAAATKGAALTRKLLAFSRKQLVEPRLLDLREVVLGTEEILRRIIGEHIEIVTDLPTSLGMVRVDPTQLEQAIMNLAVNAGDAMPTGGRLAIRAFDVPGPHAAPDRDLPPGEYVALSVRDTGVGMDAQVQSHLFEPFFTTKERGKGTGLGLSTVYGFVSLAGGHIRVASEPGRGTTFHVYLPRAAGAAPAAATTTSVSPLRGGTETVLVVEDETSVRDLLSRVLRGHGYTVLAADRGAEALRIFGRDPAAVDLVVTDIVMPGGMSGRELTARLHEARPGVPVLLISGYEDEPRGTVVENTLATPLLKKPFTPETLARMVREILDGSKARA